jgi:putative ATP-dependent endonuclease of OLD family
VQTLEADIAPLLAAQMIAAHDELGKSARSRKKFHDAVTAVADDEYDAGDLDQLLYRIEYVSKGRYAQRLAEHVEDDGPAILSVIADALAEQDTADANADLTPDELIELGPFGYLLAALDHISRQVRNTGLIKRSDVAISPSDAESQ